MRIFFILLTIFFQQISSATEIEKNFNEILITDAMVIAGTGVPAEGPYDVHLKNGVIAAIQSSSEESKLRTQVKEHISAEGKYVLPGFINMHAHIMHERAGIDMPQPYQYYLWLASGITTVRDVGSDLERTLKARRDSNELKIAAPRILAYPGIWGSHSEANLSQRIKSLKKQKVDGLKFGMMDKQTFLHASKLAQKYKLPVANHVGVEDMNALDNIAMKTSTIEHWYGVPDAALNGVQHFPAEMNYNNELHRFRFAGRLWREADPEKLDKVLTKMVDSGVAWDPTLVIYEASRDLQRALTAPWFEDYLHPGLEKFFQPNPESHGSFFWGWTSADEAYWKENYQLWFKALQSFSDKGGVITTGEDGGYIYQLYGFGYLRELQLHQEAGFQPLEVIKHATVNGAQVLGLADSIGKIKVGYSADLLIVNGNPLADFNILLPRGIQPITHKQSAGGIEWTIKQGVAYHAPSMLQKVREMVKSSRAENPINYLVPADVSVHQSTTE